MPAVGSWSTTPLVAQGVTGPHTRTAGELVVDLVDAYCAGWSAPIVAERLREMAHADLDNEDVTLLEGLAALLEEALR
jgi:hypothetical protein